MFRKLLEAYTSHQESGLSDLRGVARRFRSDQRGGVAVIAGVSLIPLIMIVGLGVEVTYWTVVKAELQRTVDLAALAGAKEYLVVPNNFENAANAAANLAELNDGTLGGTSRTWNPTSNLLTVNRISAQVMDGIRNPNGKAVKVVASQAVPLMLTKVMGATLPMTITATGWAEVLAAAVEPCLLALDSKGAGVNVQGNVTLNLRGCSVRSNATISTGGNSASMSADAFYAAGNITGSGYNGGLFPNDGIVLDPYANSPVTDALKRLNPGQGIPLNEAQNGNTPLSPTQAPNGWSGWGSIKGTVTLASGIYYVNGDISLGGQGRLTGVGVTIIMSGILSMDGGSVINLSASKAGAETGGAIKGIVFAGNSTGVSSFYGNTAPSLTGVVYYPKGDLNFGGTAGGGSTGCLEVVAKSITLKGNPSLAAVCKDYGTVPPSRDGSTGTTPTASLTQ